MRWRTPSVALATAVVLGFSGLTAPAAFAATPDHTIAEVQGTGTATPLLGQTVTVEGVVTADYRDVSNFRGLFVQSATPSGIAGASDGVFVYLNQANPAVSIGDLVTVTGTAGENGGQTQISATAVDQVTLVTAAVGVPTAVSLPDSVVGSAWPISIVRCSPTVRKTAVGSLRSATSWLTRSWRQPRMPVLRSP